VSFLVNTMGQISKIQQETKH